MANEGLGELSWESIQVRLEPLIVALLAGQRYRFNDLTVQVIRDVLSEEGGPEGVYAICRIGENCPVYIGRSRDLADRIGNNHRSTEENQAPVTKNIMKEYNLGSMYEARDYFFDNFEVCFAGVSDVNLRATLEIYGFIKLRPIYNSLLEH